MRFVRVRDQTESRRSSEDRSQAPVRRDRRGETRRRIGVHLSMMGALAPPNGNIDRLNYERANAVAAFGFSDRQARFMVTVMLHSGVFVGRQYCAFAGITHDEKVHDFVEKLLAKRFATHRQ